MTDESDPRYRESMIDSGRGALLGDRSGVPPHTVRPIPPPPGAVPAGVPADAVPDGVLAFVPTYTSVEDGRHAIHPESSLADDYIRRYWTPVLSPTAYVLLGVVAHGIVHETSGGASTPWRVTTNHLAKLVGVAPDQLPRVLRRLCEFGPVRELEPRLWGVPWEWPDLPRRFVKRLYPVLRVEHDDMQDAVTCSHREYRFRPDGQYECASCERWLPGEWVLAKEMNP